jgi:hypothetical protein
MRKYYRIFRFNFTEKQARSLLLFKGAGKLYVALRKPDFPLLDEKEILGEVVNVEQHPSFIKVKVEFFNLRMLPRTVLCDTNVILTASYFRPNMSNMDIVSPPFFALDVRANQAEKTDASYRNGWDATIVTSIDSKSQLMLNKKTRGLRGSRKYVRVSIF